MTYYEQYTAVTWIVVLCYILVILFGLFANVVILLAYFTDKGIQTNSFHFLLANGAITDLAMCCLFTPLLLLYRANEHAHWIELSPLCELSIFISNLCVSIQYIVFPLLAINRQDVASRPLTPWLPKEQCKTFMISAWSACAVVSLIQASMLHLPAEADDPPKLLRCILVSQKFDTFTGSFFVYSIFLYCASVLVTIRCYFEMYRRISAQESSHNVLTNDDVGRTKICVLVAIVYTVFWTPFVLVQFFGIFGPYSEMLFNLHALSSIFGVMASAVTPYLYISMDRYYKRRFKEIFKFTQDNN